MKRNVREGKKVESNSPVPNGIFDETVLFVDAVPALPLPPLLLVFSLAFALFSTVMWLAAVAVVVFMVALDVVSVELVLWALRNSRMDCDLSNRLSVCNSIGTSVAPFLFKRCCRKIDPSGIAFAVWFDFFVGAETVLAGGKRTIVWPPDVAVLISTIWWAVAFDRIGDCTKILCPDPMASFADLVTVDVVVVVVLKPECGGNWMIFSSSQLILTVPVPFNKFSNSWLFCKMIWPFSVRAPRIRMILLCWGAAVVAWWSLPGAATVANDKWDDEKSISDTSVMLSLSPSLVPLHKTAPSKLLSSDGCPAWKRRCEKTVWRSENIASSKGSPLHIWHTKEAVNFGKFNRGVVNYQVPRCQ